MSSTLLTGAHSFLRYNCGSQSLRSASNLSSIHRGIRRSQGVGFRGKEKTNEKFGERPSGGGFRDRVRERDGRGDIEGGGRSRQDFSSKRPPARKFDRTDSQRRPSSTEKLGFPAGSERIGSRWNPDDNRSGTGRRSFPDKPFSNDRRPFPEKSFSNGRRHDMNEDKGDGFSPSRSRNDRGGEDFNHSRRDGRSASDQHDRRSMTHSTRRENNSDQSGWLSGAMEDFEQFRRKEQGATREDERYGGSRKSFSKDERYGESRKPFSKDERYGESRKPFSKDERYGESRKPFSRDERYGESRKPSREDRISRYPAEKSSEDVFSSIFNNTRELRDSFKRTNSEDGEASNDGPPRFAKSSDKGIPLSIPYTTPASEFLYGTSVVETALTSKKEPRRKLYNLYIQRGENGENESRDLAMERLAKKAGVPVQHVGPDWLRLMDKMTAGRPHNGYILEASPLPKLPIISLAQLIANEDQHGFAVALDYQSREDIAINGTSNFISIPEDPSGRKPLVLFLDSIVDQGNLGGIIRTASFLGATAVAVSVRNSANFTPVVLKASAGAAEQITLFAIDKPVEFLHNSKTAGWKLYAAVAPASSPKPGDPLPKTIDQLGDPLADNPCVLMLGNEGEGLRWNLRNKAHFDLSIPGSSQRGAVDSLNVSVAAGILVNAFLKNGTLTPENRAKEFMSPKSDLF